MKRIDSGGFIAVCGSNSDIPASESKLEVKRVQ